MNNTVDSSTPDATTSTLATELAGVEEAFNRAMISNDVSQISACVAEDWVLVTPEAGVVSRGRILRAIEAGELNHDTMTKTVSRVRVYGDIALVTGRGQNTGFFREQRMAADEWITDVFRRIDGRWLCVLTHLTPAVP
jgi:ketosteroid isomerase-like protein